MTRPSGLAASLLVAFSALRVAEAQGPAIVERVDIAHNRTLQAETLLFYVSTKPGDRYDEQRLREDFRRLLDTGLLEDLRLEVGDGATGKIVVFDVTERRRIRSVEYRGSRQLKAAAIGAELKARGADLAADTLYDEARARKAEAAIRELLARKGRPFPTVAHEARDAGPAGADLVFSIDDGPRTKLKEIVFTGNRAFPAGELRRRMKGPEDVERVRELYLDHGYVAAAVGPAKVTYPEQRGSPAGVRWMRLEVPIQEGAQYRVGQVRIEGLTVFGEEEVRGLFELRQGEVYDESKIRRGYDRLREMYGRRGYLQWTAATRRSPDPARQVVDLVLALDEDKRYSVGRIRFAGNATTRDRVARREVLLNEGDAFDSEALRQSIRRIEQLGYFEPLAGPPELSPGAREDSLDVTFKVRERSGSHYSLGGGTSDTEGTFLNAAFSTTNFLGRGETLAVTAQAGSLVRDYGLSLTEPYVLGRPFSAGFEVFNRKLTYRTETAQGVQGYVDRRTGGSLTGGLPLGKWSRLSLGYSYQVVDISLRDATGPEGASLLDSGFVRDVGRRHESTLRPALVRNTLDDLFAPRRGTRLTLSLPVTGGPLGGDLDLVKPDLEAVAYLPHTSRTGLGLRAEAGFVLPFGDTARDGLPFDQRSFLGGESQIRGYDIRSVGPRDASGQVVGGNKYLLLNAEYAWDVAKPIRLLLFYDAGQAYADGQPFDFGRLRTSTGIEARITLPVLKLPFRFIYAVNPNRDPAQPARAFKFAIGTTF